MFVKPSFGAGFRENFKELLRPKIRAATKAELFTEPTASFEGFWRNLHDLISLSKPALPKTTSLPNRTKNIEMNGPQFLRAQFLSIAAHFLLLILIIVPIFSRHAKPAPNDPSVPKRFTQIGRYLPKVAPAKKQPLQGGGTGGAKDVAEASKGKPAPFARIQLAPPRVRTMENAKLLAPPTIIGDPRIFIPSNLSNIGDPHMRTVSESSGPGGPNGVGSRNGDGIGDGIGDGLGDGEESGTGGGVPCGGCNGNSMPMCSFCPRADYSDEAVKAKYEGIVVLIVVIGLDGRATDIHVSKGLGLGLDQKAVEAVRSWRFKPAVGPDRRPIAVRVPIEVVFHLY